MKEKLQHAKDLLAHRSPGADECAVLEEALEALIEKLEKRKYGATEKPRPGTRPTSGNPRHIPAHVRRLVRARDQDRCTFVGENGHRCGERRLLEFDHVEPIGRGGTSTVGNLRLRCRAHNRYVAEQIYGPGFMKAKVEEARRAAACKQAEEVVPWLQALGIRADQARAAAERTDPSATLEERVKAALRCFGPRDVLLGRAAPAS